ncbi:uncharacterized protein LOC131246487 isoform X2 [Magnolia sinica]|uniref:uncharacterized protein LOC131246487 isoform X2 n=1 Tax=Magnolia sinica TaxID=86752 RepID=UPI0026596B50|nr:uncharacterized protein LOC131246487 isoform X2 [Magnolia sinica]
MQAPQGVELSLILMVCSRMCKCCAKIRGVFQNFTQKFGWRMPNLHISEPCQIYPRRDEQVDGSVCGDNMIVKFRSIKGHFKSIKKLFDQLERTRISLQIQYRAAIEKSVGRSGKSKER